MVLETSDPRNHGRFYLQMLRGVHLHYEIHIGKAHDFNIDEVREAIIFLLVCRFVLLKQQMAEELFYMVVRSICLHSC